VDNETFKRFHRTHISLDDFDDALRFIRAARNHPTTSIEFESLLISAIILYARPFSGNERRKNPPIDRDLAKELVTFEGTQLDLHNRIISARNTGVAHAESVKNPLQPIVPTVPDRGTDKTFLIASGQRWNAVRDLNLDLAEFEAIAQAMREHCAIHLHDLARIAFEAETEEVVSFDWGTTIVGVLDVHTDIYTPYRGTRLIDGARRVAGCRGTVVSFNGNLCDLAKVAEILGLPPSELQLSGHHDDMLEITSAVLWPGPKPILGGGGLAERFASLCRDVQIPSSPFPDVPYVDDNWRDCYMAAQLWKKWRRGELSAE
jgi:hypothetical protein